MASLLLRQVLLACALLLGASALGRSAAPGGALARAWREAASAVLMPAVITGVVACGVKAWIFDGGYIDVMATPHLRAASDYGELATTLQIPFQLYELVCAVCVKRLRGKSFELVLHLSLIHI